MVVVLPRRSGAHMPAKGSRFVVGKIERYMFQKFRDDNPFGVLVCESPAGLASELCASRLPVCELFGRHAVDDRVLDLKPMRETAMGWALGTRAALPCRQCGSGLLQCTGSMSFWHVELKRGLLARGSKQ
jgi:hypothetical protein